MTVDRAMLAEGLDPKVQARWRYGNIVKAIARTRRHLANSMAHTPKPRPADVARWAAMQARIGELVEMAEAMRPGDRRHIEAARLEGGDA